VSFRFFHIKIFLVFNGNNFAKNFLGHLVLGVGKYTTVYFWLLFPHLFVLLFSLPKYGGILQATDEVTLTENVIR
jgi:hypothetical protein